MAAMRPLCQCRAPAWRVRGLRRRTVRGRVGHDLTAVVVGVGSVVDRAYDGPFSIGWMVPGSHLSARALEPPVRHPWRACNTRRGITLPGIAGHDVGRCDHTKSTTRGDAAVFGAVR
jgi:hypothetical protein